MSADTTPIVEELAQVYGDYLKLDLSNHTKGFHVMYEDIMMRLEEFQSIIEMVESESSECIDQHIPKLQEMREEVGNLFKKIDDLKNVIAMVNINLTTLEAALDRAEAEAGISGRSFGILNPLSFFKKTQEPVVQSRLPVYEPPTIYKTDDYFKSE